STGSRRTPRSKRSATTASVRTRSSRPAGSSCGSPGPRSTAARRTSVGRSARPGAYWRRDPRGSQHVRPEYVVSSVLRTPGWLRRQVAVEDALCDHLDLDAVVHGLGLDETPRGLLVHGVTVHQLALGAVDQLARLEPLLEIADVALERR